MEGRRIGVVDGQPKMAEFASLFRPTLAAPAYGTIYLPTMVIDQFFYHGHHPYIFTLILSLSLAATFFCFVLAVDRVVRRNGRERVGM
jgi:hypothetical protein